MTRKKILVAMSGGVDSSVTACLLCEQGHEVLGLFMRVGVELPEPEPAGCASDVDAPTDTPSDTPSDESSDAVAPRGCCSAADAADARFVAGTLDIPFYTVNFKADFDRIIDYFADEYVNGRTPNPCIQCNTWLKFGKLVEYADAIGADYVATGHYARIEHRSDRLVLRQGVDRRKDQSYFLFGVKPGMLSRALFPVGHLSKDQVRAEADRFKLPVTHKPDSVEICFVPDDDYARLVRERRPEAMREGDVLDADGNVVGRHRGIANYTIGQRRGLGIAAGRPVYVTSLNAQANTVILGDREHLMHRSLIARELNFFCDPPRDPIVCSARIRYQHTPASCTARVLDDGSLRVDFYEPQNAIAPGQAVVLYDDDVVLGGGWIERSG